MADQIEKGVRFRYSPSWPWVLIGFAYSFKSLRVTHKIYNKDQTMRELKPEYLFEGNFTVSGTMLIGDGGLGTRIIMPVTGGTINGPRIKATVKNFGADWLLIRHDKVCEVDVRLVLESDDGARIQMSYTGIIDLTEDQVKKFLKGEPTPVGTRVHTAPRFETGHPKYLWLNKIMAVAIGEIDSTEEPAKIDYSVYALR